MATSYYFYGHQRVGLLRGREKMVYWCMPLFLPYFLSLFYHFFSFFLSILSLLLVSYYSPAMGCSPFLVFPFPGFLSLGAYYSLTMGFPPLSASLHWVSLKSPWICGIAPTIPSSNQLLSLKNCVRWWI